MRILNSGGADVLPNGVEGACIEVIRNEKASILRYRLSQNLVQTTSVNRTASKIAEEKNLNASADQGDSTQEGEQTHKTTAINQNARGKLTL
ncbi:hypothetical protein Q1M63_03580 (plasmid) [Sinorhizobium meliloti]|nr:hypothetical protein Q1M63_03580 [Sinorhizobium meliloti]